MNQKDRELCNAYQREYYKKNKEKIKLAVKKWESKNIQKSNEYRKNWSAKNRPSPEERQKYNLKYYETFIKKFGIDKWYEKRNIYRIKFQQKKKEKEVKNEHRII